MSFSISVAGSGEPSGDETATIEVLLQEFVMDLKSAGYEVAHATAHADGKTINGLKPGDDEETPAAGASTTPPPDDAA
jgi:hypothetical protein